MMKSIIAGFSLAALSVAAHAAPEVKLQPSFNSVAVGQEFEVSVNALGFGTTSGGLTIDNFTGGQKLDFTFQSSKLQVLSVTIDPRWTFTTGNKVGTIDNVNGTLKGVAFGVFPATTDDDFAIATIKVRAIGAGNATLDLTNGTFIGKVNNKAGQAIAATMGQADVVVTAVPEPQTLAMLLAGLGFVGFVARRRA
ncbi:FxDxF family PEP-CTERM protein [Roseateles albus]|uniref:FxDxF family PEP-CTERM protein n=1 Tax=Roseateles albus TaxID=2987525 RepID=A0ABT5KG13_9BURK|nr:FxDxF family PEP-CTERM protein [Roseateles albus]MDC8772872.1 FxDxF family PEP-CTERM protein [Roseateles albus]